MLKIYLLSKPYHDVKQTILIFFNYFLSFFINLLAMRRFIPAIPGHVSIQRLEKPFPKIYYAPEWRLDQSGQRDGSSENYSPMFNYGVTPEKWEYLNKVVWPPNYVVPETGKAKAREIFHCRESIHLQPKKIFNACIYAKNMVVGDAIQQLRHKPTKPTLLVAEVVEEAAERAKNQFKIEKPLENMFVAEAFAIQSKIIKGAKRHAHSRWCFLRYRYMNLFIRLQEGKPPEFKGREAIPDGWDKMSDYYGYLRSRDYKYSI